MLYQILLSEKAKDDLSKLDTLIAQRIAKKLKEYRASQKPMNYSKPLSGDLRGLYRFRVGNYRVIFQKTANGKLVVLLVLRVKHRKDIYE
ncbi:type II toxin-antitoxin system mRNA interferase toxin, RelE/StbE family [Patescibacteria group bacterium]|nr:type II toxin-antitoxin system mRNA interferase toxin, RelE/StbE family [Patescibacteria group bacterium]